MSARSLATDGHERESAGPGRRLDITVLMGGSSPERQVSLMSGSAIADAIERLGHTAVRADILPSDVSALDDWMVIEEFHPPAIVCPWLEDMPPPVVLKPVDGGSSVDITIAPDAAARDEALADLLDKYGRAMIERFVDGRELTVGIVGDQPLPVLEVIPARKFYDYRAKYADDAGTGYEFEHGLPADCTEALQQDALAAHRALGCRDLSRVDFILDAENRRQVLEINTIPGFTSHSLVPMAAKRIGLSFDDLIERLVNLALAH